MRNVVLKVARVLGVRWAVARIGEAARGELGPRAHALYWWLAGAKTWTSMLCGVLAACLAAFGLEPAAQVLALVAGVGVAVGLLDKAYRTPHVPAVLAQSTLYRLLAARSAEITAVLVAAFAYVRGAGCEPLALWRVTLACDQQQAVLVVLVCVAGYLGLLDASFAARAPQPPGSWQRWRSANAALPYVLLALLPLLCSACGSSAQLQIGRGAVVHPDRQVVRSYVCAGHEDAARLYLEDPAYAWLGPARERYLVDARDARLRGECPCAAPGCPGVR